MKNTRTLRCDVPNEVWDRLAAEAAAAGIPLGRLVANLIVKRDQRKQDARS